MMENVWKILPLFAATLLMLPHMEAQHFAPPRPLCASQFALASYACSLLPTNPVPPVPSPPEDGEEDDDDDDDDDDDSDDDDSNDDDDDSGQASDGGGNGGSGGSSGAGGGGNGGGGSSDDNVVRGGDSVPTTAHGHGRAHSHVHGHAHSHGHHRVSGHDGHRRKKLRHHKRRHRHKHMHHHKALQMSLSPQEDNCCKWLTQLDNQCACELLLRLPTFLLKPAHTYSVYIGSSCNITYICPHP